MTYSGAKSWNPGGLFSGGKGNFGPSVIETGIVSPPATSPPAAVTRPLDVAQKAASLGDVVPIVFCRQVAGVGGVLISPSATEARFVNSATNQVTAFYLLVLGEGLMDSIPVRDVFSGGCRHGSHTQTFNRRAGDWIPENAIVQRSGLHAAKLPAELRQHWQLPRHLNAQLLAAGG
jgi:hypothetical protein